MPDQEEPILIGGMRSGNVEIVQALIDARADVNITGRLGEIPLHIAAEKDDVALVRLLLESGANAASRSRFEESPATLLGTPDRPLPKPNLLVRINSML